MLWHADRIEGRRPLKWRRLGTVEAPNHPYAVRAFIDAGVFTFADLPRTRVAHDGDARLVSEAKEAK